MPHTVYLALGTNLGDRLANLKAGIAALAPEVLPRACSPVYETPPWGYTRQEKFLNQVVRAETGLAPEALLEVLKRKEARLGRKPTFRYGPRLIDVDILFYDDLVYESPALTIPHPRLAERAFVLLPLADLAPDLRHPISGARVREMLSGVDTAGITWFDPGKLP